MAERHRPQLFTLSLDEAFADALVEGIIARHDDGPFGLADGLLLLPNARAANSVRDAFIRARGAACLLPRITTIGDGDWEGAVGGALDRLDFDDDAPLPRAIAPLHRIMLLAESIANARGDVTRDGALALAQSLANVIDQLAVEEVDVRELAAAAPDDAILSAHWQTAYALVTDFLPPWAALLAARDEMDPAARRNALFDRTARRWQAKGLPAKWVVAAGISTGAPAVARLLSTVARLAGGAVVFPHIDLSMADEQWDSMGDDPRRRLRDNAPPNGEEGHPLFHLKLLLERMSVSRREIAPWVERGRAADPLGRVALVRAMTTPIAFADDWLELSKNMRAPGVRLGDFANEAEEAQAIALAMREALETPGRTAALVTPDRGIATRVAAHLGRWGIKADDSAGVPLSATAAGEFLLLNAAISDAANPHDLVALLSHPLAGSAGDRRGWMDNVRSLDLLLRGPRGAPGFATISRRLFARHDETSAIAEWWRGVCAQLDGPSDGLTLSQHLDRLRARAEGLAGDALWGGVDGRALATWFAEVADVAVLWPAPLASTDVAAVLRRLMQDVPVRPPYQNHPRLAILGLIESRLHRADLMILAGLNEGQWPMPGAIDPWLSPQLRARLGLPTLDRQTGLAAHDFISALGAQDVLITRAARVGGAPAIPSRLRLRLDALLGDKGRDIVADKNLRHWAKMLDARAAQPIGRPAFAPPAARRPMNLRVTDVDTLRADPFSFYARAGLGLRLLDPLDAAPTAAWLGTAAHDVLELWLKAGDWSDLAMDGAVAVMLDRIEAGGALRSVWAPRLTAALHYFAASIRERRANGIHPLIDASENRGELSIDGVTLSGKPDRIDRLVDQTLALIDYKSGSGPDDKQVDAGHALQLGLLGLIAEQGGFGVHAAKVSEFAYWRLSRDDKRQDFGKIAVPFRKKDPEITADNFVAVAEEHLHAAIARWLNGSEPFVAKLIPKWSKYSDFEHLMRLEEWFGALALGGDMA
ncbi:MAG: PD-(D/E)XK nuclease family protein [Sphingomonadaceae bacterium]|nr:PD-(D/E)XK nuclease family protein [Sphingomonadaceae bacterium]